MNKVLKRDPFVPEELFAFVSLCLSRPKLVDFSLRLLSVRSRVCIREK